MNTAKKILSIAFLSLSLVLPSQAFAAGGTLSFSPASGTLNQGCPFSAQILVDTGGAQTDGTDTIIDYDPTRLTVTSISNGTIYSQYPLSSYDNSAGKITISAIASINSPFTGNGVFATVNFTIPQSAQTGVAQLNFEFDPTNPTKTTDSNIIQRGTTADILKQVVNGNYTIGTGTCGATDTTLTTVPTKTYGIGSSTSLSTGTKTYATTPTLAVSGSNEMTIVAAAGGILVLLGVLGLAIL